MMRRELVHRFLLGSLAIAVCSLPAARASATTWYWDRNGTASGAGDTPSGTWGVNSDWNSNSLGLSGGLFTATTGPSDNLYFVANPSISSGENAYTVNVINTQSAFGLWFQSSGSALLSPSGTGTINLWGGGINVPQYAYGTTAQGAVNILGTHQPIGCSNVDQQFEQSINDCWDRDQRGIHVDRGWLR